MADEFDGIPIYDGAGNRVNVAFLRQHFGSGLHATWNPDTWKLVRIDLPEGAMTTWVAFLDGNGNVMPGVNVLWSWPDGAVPVPSDSGGRSYWVIGNSIWIDPGHTSGDPSHYTGPYRAEGGDFSCTGIGWSAGTNHMKPAFTFQKAAGRQPPIDPGQPGDGGLTADQLAEMIAIDNEMRRLTEQIMQLDARLAALVREVS